MVFPKIISGLIVLSLLSKKYEIMQQYQKLKTPVLFKNPTDDLKSKKLVTLTSNARVAVSNT